LTVNNFYNFIQHALKNDKVMSSQQWLCNEYNSSQILFLDSTHTLWFEIFHVSHHSNYPISANTNTVLPVLSIFAYILISDMKYHRASCSLWKSLT
jgi:hypothetical protein